jgi:Fe2+ transport system protein FeoA
MKRKKHTKVYIDGKRVKVSDCKKIKGFSSLKDKLRSLTFMPGSSCTQEVKLTNGKTMKIIVKDTRKTIDRW